MTLSKFINTCQFESKVKHSKHSPLFGPKLGGSLESLKMVGFGWMSWVSGM